MSTAQAAFNLLAMLMAVDGEVEQAEREVIARFLGERFPNQLDADAAQRALAALETADLQAVYDASIEHYRTNATADDRNMLLMTGLDVVMSDGKLTEHEQELFRSISMAWGLKFEALVAQHTQQMRNRPTG